VIAIDAKCSPHRHAVRLVRWSYRAELPVVPFRAIAWNYEVVDFHTDNRVATSIILQRFRCKALLFNVDWAATGLRRQRRGAESACCLMPARMSKAKSTETPDGLRSQLDQGPLQRWRKRGKLRISHAFCRQGV